MKTDSLFYRLFQEAPAILLQLGGLSPAESAQQAPGYTFQSVELKQTAFRIDGVLLPHSPEGDRPVWFVEVQFQKDPILYHRLFSEMTLFLRQNSNILDWRVVVLFPRHSFEPDSTDLYRELLQSDRVFRVFIEDFPTTADLPLSLALVKLITEPESKAIEVAKDLLERVPQETVEDLSIADLMDLIKTIVMYKFEQLSREEIEAMLGLADLKQTRVYQEALEEGLERGLLQGLERGLLQGLERGLEQGLEQGLERGLERGLEQGLERGLEQGLEQGLKRDRQELVKPLLERLFGDLDESLQGTIVSLSELSADRFVSVLLALSQPVENRKTAIVSVWQARFNQSPESCLEGLNGLNEAELLAQLKQAIVSSAIPPQG